MRIIITNNGKEVINKLYSSQSASDIFNNSSDQTLSRNIKTFIPKINPISQNNYNSVNQKNLDNNINSFNDESKLPIHTSNNSNLLSSNNNINIIYPKMIKLKDKNFKMPLSFVKKYMRDQNLKNDDKVEVPIVTQSLNVLSALEKNLSNNNNNNKNQNIKNNSKLNSINNSNITIEEESKSKTISKSNSRLSSGKSGVSNIYLPRIKSQYSIGEIINKNCFDKLNKKIKEKMDEQKYDLKIDKSILRKYWSAKSIFDEIKKEKNKTIDATNYKLIEYLMKKTSISKNFLKKLNKCDDEKLTQLNKISGKVLIEKEIEKKFNKKIREKLENQKIKETLQFRQILLKIKNKVKNNIKDNHMNNYLLVKDSNKAVYRNVYKKFRQQYWKKSDNFSRFFPKYQRIHYEEI